MRNRVKVCCVSSLAEAKMAIQAGANTLGLVGPVPSEPGVADDAVAAAVVSIYPSTPRSHRHRPTL
ncbi:MAG: hypothetical protein LH609_01920 [Rudanella sp.]|nr:hypothetical protein [Rudanella sp.]